MWTRKSFTGSIADTIRGDRIRGLVLIVIGIAGPGNFRISHGSPIAGAPAAGPAGRPGALLVGCLAAFLGAGMLLLAGCSRSRGDMVDQIVEMEGGGYQEREVSPQRIEEIEKEIERYRKEVERKVKATGQLGVYYKMLAVEYMEGGMYEAAYDALQQALAIQPENPILFYYSAVCAARMGKAQVLSQDRASWLDRSERLYLRALDLDPGYADALYGLSVLYVFELDRPEDAEILLEKLLTVESKEINGRFLLARVYYIQGKLEQAMEVYREIERLSNVEQTRREARKDRTRIEEELYGTQ
jgi:cytochrome c-type biogenesis protein CcmH/NrfG